MRFEPEPAGIGKRIDLPSVPPCRFVAVAMHLAMVSSTKRNGELIADLAPERAALREAKMMCIAGMPTAYQTRLVGDMPDMIAIPHPPRLCQRKQALFDRRIDGFASPLLASMGFGSIQVGFYELTIGLVFLGGKTCQFRGKFLFDAQGVDAGQPVLVGEATLGPEGSIVT
jgi:hypothetical protein